MRKILAGVAVVLVCAGCASTEQTSAHSTPTPAPSATQLVTLSAGGQAQAPGPTLPAASWDPASEQSAKDTASKAMTLFARPRVDQRQWITDLSPLLAPAYRTEAEYINPARVPVSSVLSGPELAVGQGSALAATATFKTNAGEWVVLLHRTGQMDPWKVTSIAAKTA